jgi:serine/threonine protein kinase
MAVLIGQTLGPYQVIELVGQGAIATVYKAYHPKLDRYVAIKVIASDYAQEPDFLESFSREAQIIAQLDHPHILPFYDFDRQGDICYIVMKYMPGCLSDRLGQPLPLAETIRIVEQIADALDYAHGHGILHCDVKPANLLIDEEDWIYLTDFGLARIMDESQRTKSGVRTNVPACPSPQRKWPWPAEIWPAVHALKLILAEILTGRVPYAGTPAYISPEQGADLPVDARTDVYALGVILFEMLTGRVPYDAETPIAIVIKHIINPIPHARQLNPNLPEAVEPILLKALAKDPAARFASAGELVAVLRQTKSNFEPNVTTLPPLALIR